MAKKTTKSAAKAAPKKARKKARKKPGPKPGSKNRKKSGPKPGSKRGRPTDVNLIKNLEARIQEVKDRMAKKNLKDTPNVKSATKALKAISSAMVASKKSGDPHMRHALADGYRAIAKHFAAKGYKTPKANLPRGRRPK